MADNNIQATGGIGFFGLLTIVFITLKLVGVIAWPWLWVLSPLWLPIAIGGGILFITFMVVWASSLLEWGLERMDK